VSKDGRANDSRFPPLTSTHDKRIKSVWPMERVAGLLFEQLPIEDRLPGSPSLEVDMEDNTLVLRQFYGPPDRREKDVRRT